jgi:hypothetical protein
VGAFEADASAAPLVLLIVVVLAFRFRRVIGRAIARAWAPTLSDRHSSAAGTWIVSDQRLLDAMRLAAELRRGPPPSLDAPFPLGRGERVLFSLTSCQISVLQADDVSYNRWGTKLIQKSIAGYFVTPLINALRNSRAREKAKRQTLRTATWSEFETGDVYLTNRSLVIGSDLVGGPIRLRSISRIKRGDSGVSFQVGVETKDQLAGQVILQYSNDDWLYVALLYSVRRKPPRVRMSESFKSRAVSAGRDLTGLEG